jgi:hypothetical protein
MTKFALFAAMLVALSGCVIPFAFPVGPIDDPQPPPANDGTQ